MSIKQATCLYCRKKFNRNKVPFVVIPTAHNPRYLHADCAEGYSIKTKRVLDSPIDPSKEFMCEFCHKGIPKGLEVPLPGDRYAHTECYSQDQQSEKSDYDKLFEYIMKLYNESFVNPAKQKSIQKMMEEFGFTYSGIHGTLVYIYEILRKNPTDSNYLGIVPYYYIKAKEYYAKMAKVKTINSKKDIENYKPKQIIVKSKERNRQSVKETKFSILDE